MPKRDDILKRLRKELAEANGTITQQQRDIDRYQEQWKDYEKAKTDLKAARIALRLHQDYVFMLLEFLRAARALPEDTDVIIANFDSALQLWKIK